jgi:hypothetical protein
VVTLVFNPYVALEDAYEGPGTYYWRVEFERSKTEFFIVPATVGLEASVAEGTHVITLTISWDEQPRRGGARNKASTVALHHLTTKGAKATKKNNSF